MQFLVPCPMVSHRCLLEVMPVGMPCQKPDGRTLDSLLARMAVGVSCPRPSGLTLDTSSQPISQCPPLFVSIRVLRLSHDGVWVVRFSQGLSQLMSTESFRLSLNTNFLYDENTHRSFAPFASSRRCACPLL